MTKTLNNNLLSELNLKHSGTTMYELIKKLYPICRSITGVGVRQTLSILQNFIPLQVKNVPSGTKVLDWTVPLEWNIKDAWVKDSKGNKVIDFKKSNLHLVSYSQPINKKLSLKELKKHLYTIPNHPDLIPYRTTYYNKDWGFCLAHKDLLKLKNEQYEVYIDSTLTAGNLTYGEYYLPGKTKNEVLISTHICHPSLANENLSGIAVSAFLGKKLKSRKLHYSYRFLFIPATIGSITWLSLNKSHLSNIKNGLVIIGVGDRGPLTYKKSRRSDSEIDQVMEYVVQTSEMKNKVIDFYPYGYDERQYCSPGFNLPMGTFMRSQHGTYKEYHTSADNLNFVKPLKLAESLSICLKAIYILENNRFYNRLNPFGEPQLGKRGIYKAMNTSDTGAKNLQMAILWILNFSDGSNSLLDIAKRSNINFETLIVAAQLLLEKRLIKSTNQV